MTFEEAITYSIDQITGGFVKWRDHIKAQDAAYGETVKPLREQLEVYRAALLHKLQEQKIKSCKTDEGTPYISEVDSFTVTDWEAFHAFVEEQQERDFLVKNCSKTKVQEWLEEHGTLPPGIKKTSAINLNVRS